MMHKSQQFMLLALAQSRHALPHCRPNPPVGCVIVHNGRVVSTGFTRSPGLYHAEADALSSLTLPVEACEIYVTPEPCAFQGRTPSCALTLARLRPRHIYIAIEDPHPRNRGEGIAILKQAGIGVTLGVARNDVECFLAPYLIRSLA